MFLKSCYLCCYLLVLSDPTLHTNRISSVIVRVFALNAVDLEFEPRSCQDSLNLYATLRRKSNHWVMCPSGATCVPVNCCFSELETKRFEIIIYSP